MSRTKEDIEQQIVSAEETLKKLESRRPELTEKLEKAAKDFNLAQEEKTNYEASVVNQRRLICDLVDELEGRSEDEKDFDGCPHEWQKIAINFMRKHPGVDIHFTALIAAAKDELKDVKITKSRSDMLNLMSHLIVGGKVEKGKNGNYRWKVFPKNWGAPVQVPFTTLKFGTRADHERLVNMAVDEVVKMGTLVLKLQTKEIFSRICREQGYYEPDPVETPVKTVFEHFFDSQAVAGGKLDSYTKLKGNHADVHTEWGYIAAGTFPPAGWVHTPPTIVPLPPEIKRPRPKLVG